MSVLFSLMGLAIRKIPLLQRLLFMLGNRQYRILYYHMVSEKNPEYYFKDKGIPFEVFKSQLQYFKKWFTFISLDEALNRLNQGLPLEGYMSVTTDDGFEENYTLIAPYLLQEKIPATFFLINDCIGNKNLMWRNKLVYIINKLGEEGSARLMHEFAVQEQLPLPRKKDDLLTWSKRVFDMEDKERLTNMLWEKSNLEPIAQFLAEKKPYMSEQQIRELADQGFGIGGHSNTHPYCKKLNYSQLEAEITGSLQGIYDKTGINVSLFSYPFGSRADDSYENRIIADHGRDLKALIGIKSCLNNRDPYHWERDLMEQSLNLAMFRFFVVPLFRKLSMIIKIKPNASHANPY
jgi:peptidoglycan/xylan/chitin deacetylase (PgdA/CDA1 family)